MIIKLIKPILAFECFRQACCQTILSFLDSWGQDEPPTLRDAQQIPEVEMNCFGFAGLGLGWCLVCCNAVPSVKSVPAAAK